MINWTNVYTGSTKCICISDNLKTLYILLTNGDIVIQNNIRGDRGRRQKCVRLRPARGQSRPPRHGCARRDVSACRRGPRGDQAVRCQQSDLRFGVPGKRALDPGVFGAFW
jgi:hypothetical protein